MENKTIVRKAKFQDLEGIVLEHCSSFKNSFSTCLGKKILFQYYQTYFDANPDLFFVAENKNKICGFVMGYYCDKNPYSIFLKNNKKKILLKTLLRLLLLDCRAWSKFFRLRKKTTVLNEKFESVSKQEKGDLLSISVLKEFRRQGIASLLIESFLNEIQNSGRKYCILSVKKNNIDAVAFYKNKGFVKYKEDTCLHYYKVLGI